MSVSIEVDFGPMQAMIDTLLTVLSELQATGVDLDDESRLLLEGWAGAAADSYGARHAAWQADHGYTTGELARAIKTLQWALDQYQDADDAILELVV